MHLTYRQLSTVLAALRIYQEEINNYGYDSLKDRPHFVDVEPMTLDEIDILCGLFNGSSSQPVTPQPEESDPTTITCTCHLKEQVTGPVPHCCPRHDGDYMTFLVGSTTATEPERSHSHLFLLSLFIICVHLRSSAV